ncbi:MAG: hypothetical protein AAFY84_11305 [Pseudomonadota bacterium]
MKSLIRRYIFPFLFLFALISGFGLAGKARREGIDENFLSWALSFENLESYAIALLASFAVVMIGAVADKLAK